MRRMAMCSVIALMGAAATFPCSMHQAQSADADGGPCAFKPIDIDKYGRKPFQNPPEESARDGRVATTLAVEYTDPKSIKIGGCPVTLRSYDGRLVGPTLRLKPGDTLAPLLANQLPIETPDELARQYQQEAGNSFIDTHPASFNTTNLHTHGLHVSPVGNSDNVLLAIPPQTSLPLEVRVPPNHPRGTFWYHPHTHGSTAIQVGSGMAGALIIEDDETKIPAALREANRAEKIFVFQTILYDAQGRVDDITAFFPDGSDTEKLCEEGKSGCTWRNSMRVITVNGQIVPIIHMRPGEVQRWRFIDTAFRETIMLELEGHPLHEIALDGIYLGRVDTWQAGQAIDLEPGYRSDVLVKASSTPGTYALRDLPSSAATALRGVAEPEHLLAQLVVEGEPMDMALPTDAEMQPLAPFPGVDLQAKADGVQVVTFKIGSSPNPNENRNYFQVNFAAFNPTRVRYVRLGAVDQWSLTTTGDPPSVANVAATAASAAVRRFATLAEANATAGIPPLPHVFHIHVNPFQMVRQAPKGQNETVWKDTLLVPGGQTINVYTQYLDYIGQFVLHCHILDHEDLGMMEVVEVVGSEPAKAPHGGH